MTGKSKCKILKDIRRKIASENDIPYVTSECKFQGECSGTCPKCESELRYLEQELEKRQRSGKAVAVAGIAAALMVGVSGCVVDGLTAGAPLPGEVPMSDPVYTATTAGMVTPEPLMGEPAIPDPTEETVVLMGDIPYVTEETTEPIMGELPPPTE